jgi:hypothetical protein
MRQAAGAASARIHPWVVVTRRQGMSRSRCQATGTTPGWSGTCSSCSSNMWVWLDSRQQCRQQPILVATTKGHSCDQLHSVSCMQCQ